jgi:hypothetical protein
VVAAGLDEGLFSVRESGVLLQRVHFRAFMVGYEVYIGEAGDVGSDLRNPAATVQVVGRHVRIFAHIRGVCVAGVSVPVNAAAILGSSTQIDVNGVVLDYNDLSDVRIKGWPYLGEIRRRGSNIHLAPGAVHRVGRDPSCEVRLPNDSHHGNIIWRPEVDAGVVIRSQKGDIPKARFTLDSIMVASVHAELDLTGGTPQVRNLAGGCFSFVRRGAEGGRSWIPLSRVERPTGDVETHLEPGDELYIGNCILRVDGMTGSPDCLPKEAPPPVAFSLADDPPPADQERSLPPPPPRLPVPPAPDRGPDSAALHPPPLPASHRQLPFIEASATWMEAPSVELERLAPVPSPPAPSARGAVSDVPSDPQAMLDLLAQTSSIDDAWSPFGQYTDDPTELPVPRFLQKKKDGK